MSINFSSMFCTCTVYVSGDEIKAGSMCVVPYHTDRHCLIS